MTYRFYSSPAEKVRISVVGQYEEGILKIAVARCSKKDTFIRRKGRAIAEGRLFKNKLYTAVPMQACDIVAFVDVAKQVVAEVARTKKVY